MPTPTTHARARRRPDATPWGERAACRGADLTPFFSSELHDQQAALRTCQECPVRMECLMQALKVEEEHGVWGGMLESDRRALIRQRRETREAQAVPAAASAARTHGRPLVVTTRRVETQAASLAA